MHSSKDCTLAKTAPQQELHPSKDCTLARTALYQEQHLSKNCTLQEMHLDPAVQGAAVLSFFNHYVKAGQSHMQTV